MQYIAAKDARLDGNVPPKPNLGLVIASATTPIIDILNRIRAQKPATGKEKSILILCHGYAGENARAGVCGDFGGMGLEFAMENVTHSNVSLWTAIASVAESIVVYSCAAANTEPGNEGTDADGSYLMGALAVHTNTTVYAADRIQWYNNGDGYYHFGAWEGTLWKFYPNGTPRQRVTAPPVGLSDVTGS